MPCGAYSAAAKNVTAVEWRLRVAQHHLLHCDDGLVAHERPSVSNLRLDLLDAAVNYPACVTAVQSAFASHYEGGVWGPEGVGRRSVARTWRNLSGRAEALSPWDSLAAASLQRTCWWRQGVLHCTLTPGPRPRLRRSVFPRPASSSNTFSVML